MRSTCWPDGCLACEAVPVTPKLLSYLQMLRSRKCWYLPLIFHNWSPVLLTDISKIPLPKQQLGFFHCSLSTLWGISTHSPGRCYYCANVKTTIQQLPSYAIPAGDIRRLPKLIHSFPSKELLSSSLNFSQTQF
jgi:hypothetical protein